MPRGPGRQPVPLQENHVGHAHLGQMVGGLAAQAAPSDHHHIRSPAEKQSVKGAGGQPEGDTVGPLPGQRFGGARGAPVLFEGLLVGDLLLLGVLGAVAAGDGPGRRTEARPHRRHHPSHEGHDPAGRAPQTPAAVTTLSVINQPARARSLGLVC